MFTQSQTGQPIQPFIYANKVRKISEDILKRSDVGANPVNYDARVENKDLIAEINKKIEKETSADKKKNYKHN